MNGLGCLDKVWLILELFLAAIFDVNRLMALSRWHAVDLNQVVVGHGWSLLSNRRSFVLSLLSPFNGRQASILDAFSLEDGHSIPLLLKPVFGVVRAILVELVICGIRSRQLPVALQDGVLLPELGHSHHPRVVHHVGFFHELVGVLGF